MKKSAYQGLSAVKKIWWFAPWKHREKKQIDSKPIRLVFHMGAHKTATSLVQKYLRDNASLMQKNGIAFTPRSFTNDVIGWGRPKTVQAGAPKLLDLISRSQAEGNKHFIVSHENCLGRPFVPGVHGLYPNAPRTLKEIAAPYASLQPVIIFYIRNQAEFIESYYLQTIHQGGYLPFEDWRRAIDVENISWAPVAEELKRAFPDSNVVVKSFNTEISFGQEGYLKRFFAEFGDFIDADFKGFSYKIQRNLSIGDLGLKMALQMNQLLKNDAERRIVRNFLQKNFSNKSYPRPVLLSPEDKHAITMRYEAENLELTFKSRSGA